MPPARRCTHDAAGPLLWRAGGAPAPRAPPGTPRASVHPVGAVDRPGRRCACPERPRHTRAPPLPPRPRRPLRQAPPHPWRPRRCPCGPRPERSLPKPRASPRREGRSAAAQLAGDARLGVWAQGPWRDDGLPARDVRWRAIPALDGASCPALAGPSPAPPGPHHGASGCGTSEAGRPPTRLRSPCRRPPASPTSTPAPAGPRARPTDGPQQAIAAPLGLHAQARAQPPRPAASGARAPRRRFPGPLPAALRRSSTPTTCEPGSHQRAGPGCLAASRVCYRPLKGSLASADHRIWGVSLHAACSWDTDQWRAKRRWPSPHNTSPPRLQRGMLMDHAAAGLHVHPRLAHEASGQRTRRLTTCGGPCNVQRG